MSGGGSAARSVAFTKMHGAGNDFVMLDGIRDDLPPMEAFAKHVGHRNFGIGCDQILVARMPRDPDSADFRMEIYNCDGSQVEMCGNGIRAFFKYLRDHGHTSADAVRVETLGGVVVPRFTAEGLVQVDMGRPVLAPAKIPTTLGQGRGGQGGSGQGDGPVLEQELALADGTRLTVSSASMGNPHAVIVVEDVEEAAVERIGAEVETHAAFPAHTNVEFIEIVDRSHIRQRTWERGVGETLACGSGACATGVTSMLRGVVDRCVEVELRGGALEIAWAGDDAPVLMTGPATEVFTGNIPIP